MQHSISCICKGTFNNYLDRILPLFDPFPPHLVHVVIEWPLRQFYIRHANCEWWITIIWLESKVGGRFNFRFFVFKTMRKVYKKRCNIKKVFWDFWTNIWDVSWTIFGDFWKKKTYRLPFVRPILIGSLSQLFCREKVKNSDREKGEERKWLLSFLS